MQRKLHKCLANSVKKQNLPMRVGAREEWVVVLSWSLLLDHSGTSSGSGARAERDVEAGAPSVRREL